MHAMSIQGHARDTGPKIEHFFQVYRDLEGHKVSTDGFEPRAAADVVIQQARERFAAVRA